MLRKTTVQDVISALRPLLGNTRISTNDRDWNQVRKDFPKDGEFMTEYMNDLGKRIQWETCPDCQREWNALAITGRCIGCEDDNEERARRDVANGEYLSKVLGPYGLERYSFVTFNQTEQNARAFAACNTFNPKIDNLFLYGNCGVGKTHLAGALLKAAAGAGRSIKWANSVFLSRSLRGRFPSDEEAFVDDLARQEVLVIDDLGLAKDADALLRMIYELAEKRTARKRNGWIITSNHSLEDLTKRFGDDRLGSRLVGLFRFFHIPGTDDWRLSMRFGRNG